VILISAIDGGEWSVCHPGRFTPGERIPDTYLIGEGVGPRSGPDAVPKREKSLPQPGNEFRSSSP
jgi:hypothetical protein